MLGTLLCKDFHRRKARQEQCRYGAVDLPKTVSREQGEAPLVEEPSVCGGKPRRIGWSNPL